MAGARNDTNQHFSGPPRALESPLGAWAERRSLVASTAQIKRGSDRDAARLKVRPVAEVLGSYGLDATEEIVKLLHKGTISDIDRLRTWMGLLEYSQPKMRSTEQKVTVELTGAQVDAQLREQLARLQAERRSGARTFELHDVTDVEPAE